MKKDIYDIIKPEEEKVEKAETKKTKPVKNNLDKKVKEVKSKKDAVKKTKPIKTVKKENKFKSLVDTMGKDAIIISGIVLAMILVCVGIVAFYFYNITNANMLKSGSVSIKRKDYEIQYKLMASDMSANGQTDVAIREDLINNIAINKMLVEKFKAEGLELTEENQKIVTEFKEDKEAMKMYIEKGIKETDLIQLYTNIITAQQYSEEIQKKVSDENIKKEIIAKDGENANMDNYITRHILFAFFNNETGEPKDKAAQKEKAETILKKAKAGESFEELAKANSEDPGSKDLGGKVEMVADKEMGAAEYIDAMVTLKPGQIYPSVVETSYGYHIIKVDNIVKDGRIQNSNVKDSYAYLVIMHMLRDSKLVLNVPAIEKVEKDVAAANLTNAATSAPQ